MVVNLMEEAKQDAEHKGWCATKLSTNKPTLKEKTSSVEVLTAEVDELDATIGRLAQKNSEHTQIVANLDAAIDQPTKIREEEQARNLQKIKDAKAAQVAVSQALLIYQILLRP